MDNVDKFVNNLLCQGVGQWEVEDNPVDRDNIRRTGRRPINVFDNNVKRE